MKTRTMEVTILVKYRLMGEPGWAPLDQRVEFKHTYESYLPPEETEWIAEAGYHIGSYLPGVRGDGLLEICDYGSKSRGGRVLYVPISRLSSSVEITWSEKEKPEEKEVTG